MIKNIDHIAVFVTDMKEAVDFYSNTLDLEVGYESEHWTVINLQGTYIGLHPAESVAGFDSGSQSTQISFGVVNIEDVQQKLQERGVEFTREIEEISPGRWIANFVDPFGNRLSIYEVKEDTDH